MEELRIIVKDLFQSGAQLGILLIKAGVILVVGRLIISFLNKFVKKLMRKEKVDPSIQTFVSSLVNILLNTLLCISIIGILGIQTTSFAALLASCGLAIGMSLSGNLSNFAGGIIILTFKPFRVDDTIASSTVSGKVLEIQIFHTIIQTADGLRTYIPNGVLSSGYINNYNVYKRRVDWVISVDYGTDFDFAKKTIQTILDADDTILKDSPTLIEIKELADSSVNIIVIAWVLKDNFVTTKYAFNRNVYAKFNEVGISFPFPQLTIHTATDSPESKS